MKEPGEGQYRFCTERKELDEVARRLGLPSKKVKNVAVPVPLRPDREAQEAYRPPDKVPGRTSLHPPQKARAGLRRERAPALHLRPLRSREDRSPSSMRFFNG